MEAITEFLIDWGYWGLFLSAFIAGSVLPFSSEAVMVVLVGEAIAIVLGLMRSNVWLTAAAMLAGKTARYIVVLATFQGALTLF